MIRKSNKKIRAFQVILFMIAAILFLFVDKSVCLAASANITLSTKDEVYEKGKTFTVEIKVNSKASIGDFEGFLTYDEDVLEFVSEASFIAGGKGLIKISDINVVNGETSKKYVVKFRAKETGTSAVAFRETPSVYDFDEGITMSVSSNQLDIEVAAKALASDNGDLKELKVEPGRLSPDFDPNITTYSVNVNEGIDQMIISSIPSHEKASVSIEGNKALKPGENTIEIIVKAESGVKKIYKLTVLKEEKKEDDIKETEDGLSNNEEETDEYTNKEDTVILSKPEIIKENGGLYYQNGYKYQLLTPGTETSIPEGYIVTSMIISNTSVEVYSLKGRPDAEFVLIYAKGPTGLEGFYRFDKLENTLQRYDNTASINIGELENSDSKNTDSNESRLIIMGVMLIVLTAICIILALSLVQSNTHNKRRKKK